MKTDFKEEKAKLPSGIARYSVGAGCDGRPSERYLCGEGSGVA